MTTRSSEQQEPSMEEILSSIRRIIADEASDEEGEQGAAGSQAERHDADADADVDVPGRDAADDADDDVLELTEIVREEGEVIDLDRTLAQTRLIEPQPAEADAEQSAAHQPDPEERDEADPDEEEPALQLGASVAAGFAGPADEQPAHSPMDIQDDEMEQHQTATQKKNGLEALVSDRAAGAATGAFAKLSQAVQRTPPELAIADDSGRTVEQFVEDMMRPMLRDWLDENLPTMVERIVQREIQKIVRRAEEA